MSKYFVIDLTLRKNIKTLTFYSLKLYNHKSFGYFIDAFVLTLSIIKILYRVHAIKILFYFYFGLWFYTINHFRLNFDLFEAKVKKCEKEENKSLLIVVDSMENEQNAYC